jgi:acetolactate synthase-1/2/3 large subunit
LERVPKRNRLMMVRGVERFTDPRTLDDRQKPLAPQRAIWELQQSLPADSIFTVDSGEHTMFALHYLGLDLPDAFFFAGGLGSMGSGIGAALGVKLGCPTRPVVCICGDGSIPMNGGELLTAAQQKLPLIVAVFNNGSYRMVENGMNHVFGRSHTFGLGPMDIGHFAKGLGAETLRIEKPGDLFAAHLGTYLAGDKPLVLDIAIDPEAQMPNTDRLDALKAAHPTTGGLLS